MQLAESLRTDRSSMASEPTAIDVYTVERIAAGSIGVEEFTYRYIDRGIPVILTGATDSWPASGIWSTTYFQQHFPDTQVSVDFGTEGADRWRRLALGEYLSSFEKYKTECAAASSGRLPYLRTWNMLDDLSSLRGSYTVPPHFVDGFQGLSEDSRPPFEWVFIGPAGAKTVLHEDVWCA
mmetsp:Transcript_15333/g.42880  ORF Transcript_15333/g.42880 Transcript_15333/m.42880 type:complete len:180 (+) Transcript_15333:85-624(+)